MVHFLAQEGLVVEWMQINTESYLKKNLIEAAKDLTRSFTLKHYNKVILSHEQYSCIAMAQSKTGPYSNKHSSSSLTEL